MNGATTFCGCVVPGETVRQCVCVCVGGGYAGGEGRLHSI